MKLPIPVSKILCASAFLTVPLYAQDIDTLNKEVKQLEKQLKDLREDTEDSKDRLTDEAYQEKQKRVAKNIAEANARTQKNIAKDAKSEMYKRVLALQEQRAAYLKDLAEGKTRPFPNVVENWEYYQSQVVSLTTDYANFKATESSVDKAKLAAPLLAALQPIGPWLNNAKHSGPSKVVVSDAKAAEGDQLEERYFSTESAGLEGKLRLTTPESYFTLKHLPVPIQFVGEPDTEVVLYSEVGGKFPNDLSFISIKTDETGRASTSWVSEGDGVATCSIRYRSAELPSKRGRVSIVVRRLSLQPLEHISPVVKTAVNKTKTLTPLSQ